MSTRSTWQSFVFIRSKLSVIDLIGKMKRSNPDHDVKYAVLETSDNEGTYIEFMPQVWMVTPQNCTLKQRDMVQFHFPIRSKQQSRGVYLRFLKQAKFICSIPQNDGKWELKTGRILKLNLGSLEEALSAEKYYSDYFSTTEADNKIEEAAAPRTVLRKKKKNFKAIDKMGYDRENSDSDSDDCDVNAISNYDFHFGIDEPNLFTLDASNNILPLDIMNQSVSFTPLLSSCDPSDEVFMTLNVPLMNEEQSAEETAVSDNQLSSDKINDPHASSSNTNCCVVHQKIMNKIDYVQKKVSKELGLIRQETNAIRKLLMELMKKRDGESEGNEDDRIEGAPAALDLAAVNEFNKRYKDTFPIKDARFLIDFNKSLSVDKKFAEDVYAKLDQIKGDDETKTARKLLKEMCHSQCLKDFTWLGTKKMKSFHDLHLIVDMITKLLKGKYPQCDAINILTKVVQQRTKSAKAAWALKQNEISSKAQANGSGANNNDHPQSAGGEIVLAGKNDSPSAVGNNDSLSAVGNNDSPSTVENNESPSAGAKVIVEE